MTVFKNHPPGSGMGGTPLRKIVSEETGDRSEHIPPGSGQRHWVPTQSFAFTWGVSSEGKVHAGGLGPWTGREVQREGEGELHTPVHTSVPV